MKLPANSPYLLFGRDKWAELRKSEPMTLTEEELSNLRGINEELSMKEIEDIYLPLSRLLNYYVNSTKSRQLVIMKFLNEEPPKIPFVIGIAGSVSVGKSTASRVLQALLSRWKKHNNVALITTDGFLYPNKILEEKGLMMKKGFPESYDTKELIRFISDIKSGKTEVKAPKYSHETYDIIPGKFDTVKQPDILILEGLNVLQNRMDYPQKKARVFVSDYLDFSIYVDAEERLLENWYITRFMDYRDKAFKDTESYFHTFTKLTNEEANRVALSAWREINRRNLLENILPTRERAGLILHKSTDHKIDYVMLRK